MIIAKLSKNGQITLPKKYRDKVKAQYFVVSVKGNNCTFTPNKKNEKLKISGKDISQPFKKKKGKTLLESLKGGMYNSKHLKEKNMAYKVDEIMAEKWT
jgi:bifunctional DNA-binding transcriptional regulator/antitoxin component of YhaV-PrlF toxin-antitoxin module